MLAHAAMKDRFAMKLASAALTFAVSMLLLGSSTGAAHAYLDAGTGSMILQVLLGGVAGLVLVGKLYWHRLLLMLGVRKEPKLAEADQKALKRSEARADR
jgi:hypothetical protein